MVGEAADGVEALRKTLETRPHITLLDLTMPGPPGTQLIQEITRRAPDTRVLVLTMHDDPAYMQSALMAGASGYVVKRAADSELLSAVHAVYRGRTFVDLTRAHGEDLEPRVQPLGHRHRLSPREGQVLTLLAEGHTNQEAADRLGVSVKTVETYRSRLGDKLGLRNRAALFRFALETGLLVAKPSVPKRRGGPG